MTSSTEAVSRTTTDGVQDHYDVVVVGGGPAGLSGAKIMARSRRSVLVIDSGTPRNAPAEGVHNYLYAEGTCPSRLAEIGRAEAALYDVDIVDGVATAATVEEHPHPGASRFTVEVTAAGGRTKIVSARRLLLTTGLVDVLPDIQGMRERWGKDVLHCPFCHGWEARDQAIGVVGTGPMALHQVLLFRQLSADIVYFQHTAPDPTDDQREQLAALGVEHVAGRVTAVETKGDAISGLRMSDGRLVARRTVVVATSLEAREGILADLGLSTSDLGLGGASAGHYLNSDPVGATATPGVWAAGNLVAPMAQVVNSAAAGASAGAAIHMDLITEDTAVAVACHRARQAAGVGK